MSGLEGLGTGLDFQAGLLGSFGLAGPAAGLGIAAGIAGAIFGPGSPPVANPLPWASNPYGVQGLVWGLPLHVDDVLSGIAGARYKDQAEAFGDFPVPAAWNLGGEIVKRGGPEHMLAAFTGGETILLPAPITPTEPFPPQISAPGGSPMQLRRLHLSVFQAWGDWGDSTLPAEGAAEFVMERIQRVSAQWSVVNQPGYAPKFWDIDYRTELQFARAEFSKLPIQIVSTYWFQVFGVVDPSARLDQAIALWWASADAAGARATFAGKQEQLAELHNSTTQAWLQWRQEIADSVELSQAIEEAQSQAAAQVLEQFQSNADTYNAGPPPMEPLSVTNGVVTITPGASPQTFPTALVAGALGLLALALVLIK